ncbi:hypothetical protein J3A74_003327 [Rhodococcus sp. PvP104]|nr:hypothetical protein [Rhodococcus sp. PvP104]
MLSPRETLESESSGSIPLASSSSRKAASASLPAVGAADVVTVISVVAASVGAVSVLEHPPAMITAPIAATAAKVFFMPESNQTDRS